jgi:rubrerythrin
MTDQPDLRTEHQKRISEAMKLWWRRRRTCRECGEHPIGLDDGLCPGCDAYRDHTGHY